jgi:hypothetical protein
LDFNNLFFDIKGLSSPYINHFLQPDTLIPDPTNPQAWNRYSYVGNRPVNFNDPTGHMMTEGCGDDGKAKCHASDAEEDLNAGKLAKLEKEAGDRKCAAGNKNYCSGNPVEIAAFTATMLVGGALAETAILGGGAAAAADTVLSQAGMACARSLICWKVAVALGLFDYYPPNEYGFASSPATTTLQDGPMQIITRFGESTGKYASPIGTSFSARALPLGVDPASIKGFQIMKPIENVLVGPTQGWFGQPGGGVQYYLGIGDRTIQSLIDSGHLFELP